MKVYVVNQAGHDISKAEQLGQIIILTEGQVNIFATDRILQDLKEKMSGINKEDYILLAGYSLLNVLACLIMLTKTGVLNVLLYNFKTKEYIKRQFTQEEVR